MTCLEIPLRNNNQIDQTSKRKEPEPNSEAVSETIERNILQRWFNGMVAVGTILSTITVIYAFWVTQRAYVLIRPTGDPVFEIGKRIKIEALIENEGSSPAYHTSFGAYGTFVVDGSKNAKFVEPKISERYPETTVFPKVPVPLVNRSPKEMPPEAAAALKSNLYILYGTVNYTTLYISRYTNFCLAYNRSDNPSTVTYCNEHNDAN